MSGIYVVNAKQVYPEAMPNSCCTDPTVMCDKCYSDVMANKASGLSRKQPVGLITQTTRKKFAPLLIPVINFGKEKEGSSKDGKRTADSKLLVPPTMSFG